MEKYGDKTLDHYLKHCYYYHLYHLCSLGLQSGKQLNDSAILTPAHEQKPKFNLEDAIQCTLLLLERFTSVVHVVYHVATSVAHCS